MSCMCPTGLRWEALSRQCAADAQLWCTGHHEAPGLQRCPLLSKESHRKRWTKKQIAYTELKVLHTNCVTSYCMWNYRCIFLLYLAHVKWRPLTTWHLGLFFIVIIYIYIYTKTYMCVTFDFLAIDRKRQTSRCVSRFIWRIENVCSWTISMYLVMNLQTGNTKLLASHYPNGQRWNWEPVNL